MFTNVYSQSNITFEYVKSLPEVPSEPINLPKPVDLNSAFNKGLKSSLAQNAITISDLNLRSSPSLEGQIITIVPTSTYVNVSSCSNNWCYISFLSYKGFVSKSFLQTNSTYSLNPSSSHTERSYINSEGIKVQSPTYYNSIPSGAKAECYDGTYSFSRSRRGTCSHHGGVKRWL